MASWGMPPEYAADFARQHADFWALPRASPLARAWLFNSSGTSSLANTSGPPNLLTCPVSQVISAPGAHSALAPGIASERTSASKDFPEEVPVRSLSASYPRTPESGAGQPAGPHTDLARLRYLPSSPGLALLHICAAPNCAAGPNLSTTVLQRTTGIALSVAHYANGLTLGFFIDAVWTAGRAQNVDCIGRFAHDSATGEYLKVTAVQNYRFLIDRFVRLGRGCFMHDHIVARTMRGPSDGYGALSLSPGGPPGSFAIDSRTTAMLSRREDTSPAGAVPVPPCHDDFGLATLGVYDMRLVQPSGGFINDVAQQPPSMSTDVRAPPPHFARCRVPSAVLNRLPDGERELLRERLLSKLRSEGVPLHVTSPIGDRPPRDSIAPPLNIVEASDNLQTLDPSPSLTASSPVTWMSTSSQHLQYGTGRPPTPHAGTPISRATNMSPVASSRTRETPLARRNRSQAGSTRQPQSINVFGTNTDDRQFSDERMGDTHFSVAGQMASPPTLYGDSRGMQAGQIPRAENQVRPSPTGRPGVAVQVPRQVAATSSIPSGRRPSQQPEPFAFTSGTPQAFVQPQTSSASSVLARHMLQPRSMPANLLEESPARLSQPAEFHAAQTVASLHGHHQPSVHGPGAAPLHEQGFLGAGGASQLAMQGEPYAFSSSALTPPRPGTLLERSRMIDLQGSGGTGQGKGTDMPTVGDSLGLVQGSVADSLFLGHPGIAEDEEKIASLVPASDIGNSAGLVGAPQGMGWLDGDATNATVSFRQANAGDTANALVTSPDVRDLLSSLPTSVSQQHQTAAQGQPVPGIAGEAQSSRLAPHLPLSSRDRLSALPICSAPGSAVSAAGSGPGATRNVPSARSPVPPSSGSSNVSPEPDDVGQRRALSNLSSEYAAGAQAGSGSAADSRGRGRGRGGRGWLTATPSDIVMRNRISAQKSNEKRRRRILASKNELAVLKSVTLPRLRVLELVLRAENEQARQALASKYGSHWVSVESFF